MRRIGLLFSKPFFFKYKDFDLNLRRLTSETTSIVPIQQSNPQSKIRFAAANEI